MVAGFRSRHRRAPNPVTTCGSPTSTRHRRRRRVPVGSGRRRRADEHPRRTQWADVYLDRPRGTARPAPRERPEHLFDEPWRELLPEEPDSVFDGYAILDGPRDDAPGAPGQSHAPRRQRAQRPRSRHRCAHPHDPPFRVRARSAARSSARTADPSRGSSTPTTPRCRRSTPSTDAPRNSPSSPSHPESSRCRACTRAR